MTRHLGALRALVLSVLTLAGCTVGDAWTGEPVPGGDSGGPSMTAPDPGTTPPTSGGVAPCALVSGDYEVALTPTDAGCSAARQDLGVRRNGTLAGSICTASATAACGTTITCSVSSGLTMVTSTLVVTTRGSTATGTATVTTATTAPASCNPSQYCPAGYCMVPGQAPLTATRCFQAAGTQQCHYSVAITKV